jgi:uncharacterized RDD family membrane protein YckC
VAVPEPGAGPTFAGWGSRVGAYVVDYSIAGAIYFVSFMIAAGLDAAGAPLAIFIPFSGGGVLVFWLLPAIWMARTNGQTIGKRALGIRVVRTSGARTGFGWSLLREGPVKLLLSLLFFVDQLWPLWDRENRAVHDFVMRSRVVPASR